MEKESSGTIRMKLMNYKIRVFLMILEINELFIYIK